ncbi:uncharacterized protein MAM_04043 [Metarhizium album ARSEF 1941]|uniref:Uncharacterized protein n=1 Tax=Metarhizium album (strain ARSEF 1941) TaxID=1081103 RepID=A0A0B2WY13_METAS|nr:uncharacterized protein MAM_04043 [Metarhizium album ARSEF 1941]KHN98282.1 hypothetical protein MAM_04043 [Metarhizium album ARSEF 1941]
MVRDTPVRAPVAIAKRLSGRSARKPGTGLSPDTELRQAPTPPPPSSSSSSSPYHHTALANPYVQDPSLGIPLSSTVTPATTLSSTPSNTSTSTAVIVTIVLGTIAGVVAVGMAIILINMQLRRRRRRAQPASPVQSDKKGPSAAVSLTALNSPGAVSPFPSKTTSPSPTTRGTEMPGSGGNDAGLDELRPPPRLGERKFHQATRSEGSIDARPSRNFHHTRWGKPSSLGNIPSAKDVPSCCAGPGPAQTQDYGSPDSRAAGHRHQYTLFPVRTTTPTVKTHRPAASTSTTSTLQGTNASPPRTPKSGHFSPVNGLMSPGPPPTRALPSPPSRYWQINPLSPPLDSQTDNVRPEEIGIAIGSPVVEERREKRPRLDESDIERLGGTYSPFKKR